jgi:hypothetical protein
VSTDSWQAFYYGAWQQPWALLVAPFAFVVWRAASAAPGPGAVPEARAFVLRWSAAFVALTMLDPIATGPLAKALGGGGIGTALGLGFVLLGEPQGAKGGFGLHVVSPPVGGQPRGGPRARVGLGHDS